MLAQLVGQVLFPLLKAMVMINKSPKQRLQKISGLPLNHRQKRRKCLSTGTLAILPVNSREIKWPSSISRKDYSISKLSVMIT